MTLPLKRGATIGIIGGGQLGRMLAMAASRLGMQTIVLEPQANCPALQCCTRQIEAAYDNAQALAELADACDVITFEFENVDVATLRAISGRAKIYPPVDALEISQDRLVEKAFLNSAGLETAPFHDCPDASALQAALDEFGGRGILKTRRFGYDGKGQLRFSGDDADLTPAAAIEELKGAPAILEGFVDFDCEISVIVTRAIDGTIRCFDPARNVHENGILATSTLPSGVAADIEEEAKRLAAALAEKLGYVGTLGLEFFVTRDGALLANEFAPRVHNSGHWTEAACTIDQFEQHIRAICGWPLGDASRHSDCVMTNVIGDPIDALAEIAADSAIMVHDYGKAEARPGRKMGHYTRITPKN